MDSEFRIPGASPLPVPPRPTEYRIPSLQTNGGARQSDARDGESDFEFARRLQEQDQERLRRDRNLKTVVVVVPENHWPGMVFTHDTEDSVRLQIEVPQGKAPGDRIAIEYPSPAPRKNTPKKSPKPCIVC